MDKRCLAFGLLPLLAACSGSSDAPKNVLFLIVDDLKPILGCYGDSLVLTPNIDALAADGYIYTNAYCQQALSGPSRASLLTGLRPETVGVTELNTRIRKVSPDVVTLPQAFKDAGYLTVGVGKIFQTANDDKRSWSVAPKKYGRGRRGDYQNDYNRVAEKADAWEYLDAPEGDNYIDIGIRDKAVSRLDSIATLGQPFFLAVGYLKPHMPFVAPKRFLDLYADTDFGPIDTTHIVGAPRVAYRDNVELKGYNIPQPIPYTQDVMTELKRAYYACASYADENIGVVVDELKKLGLYDDTVIVLLGDHGYHTGEQGLWCKHTNYEAACHAPLIIKPARSGHRRRGGMHCDVPVEFIDIFPTVAELAGIPAPEGLEGKSLLHLDENAHYCAYSQFPRPYDSYLDPAVRTHMGYALRDSRWRYVEWHDMEGRLTDRELYDLGPDGFSLETVNISSDPSLQSVQDSLSILLRVAFPL